MSKMCCTFCEEECETKLIINGENYIEFCEDCGENVPIEVEDKPEIETLNELFASREEK